MRFSSSQALVAILVCSLASRASAHEHSGDWNDQILASSAKYVRRVHETSSGLDHDLVYYDIGGVNLTFGDIVLDQGYIEFLEGHAPHEVPQVPHLLGVTHEDNGRRWPCPIPFVIDGGLPNQQRITLAMEQIEMGTNWRFVQRTTEARYLKFKPADGCYSSVGKNYGSGPQDVGLANACRVGTTIHEILHAIGAWHEQSRSDRNQFITVHEENIQDGQSHNFNTYSSARRIRSYDFDSVMHYGTHAFSKNGKATITVNGGLPSGSCGLGQNKGMSPTDALSAMDRWYPTTQCPVRTKQLVPGMTVRFESVNFPGYFIRHQNYDGKLVQSDGSSVFTADSSWIVENGLSGRGLSFRSKNIASHYLARSGGALRLRGNESTKAFKIDASWNVNGALESGSGNRLSLSAVSAQGSFLRHRNFAVYADPLNSNSVLFRQDASWNLHVTSGVSYTQSQSYGGNGGSAFSDSPGAEITAINLRAAASIHSIQVEYGGVAGPVHGGNGGSAYRFELQSGESITSVCVFKDREVQAIQFHTSNGRSSPKYGGCDGELRCIFFGDERLRYISGRAGSRIDQISFWY